MSQALEKLKYLRQQGPHLLGWILVGLAGAIFIAATVLNKTWAYSQFHFSAYDLGMHVHAMWKTAFTADLFNSVRGLNTIGDHVWLINYLVAIPYRIFPRAETLFMVQSLSHAMAGLILTGFTYRISNSMTLSFAIGVSALLHPALWNMNQESFHPETIVIPFVLLTFICGYFSKWKPMWFSLALALICKEDVAITMAALGVWIAFFRDRKIGLTVVAICCIWFLVVMKVLLPLWNGHGFFRTSGGYWFSAAEFSIRGLKLILGRLFSDAGWQYFLDLVGPTGFLHLIRPDVLLIALPSFSINCLTGTDYLRSIDYHYNYLTLPFIWLSQALGTVAIWRAVSTKSRFSPAVTAVALAVTLLVGGAYAHSQRTISNVTLLPKTLRQLSNPGRSVLGDDFATIMEVFAKDPRVGVSADYNLVPNLANRHTIYMYPNPWKPSIWGIDDRHTADTLAAAHLFIWRFRLSSG